MQQKFNRLDARTTLSRRGPNMKIFEALFGKLVTLKTVWTLSATVQTQRREIHFKLVLGLLGL
jgi:hypothetical protein